MNENDEISVGVVGSDFWARYWLGEGGILFVELHGVQTGAGAEQCVAAVRKFVELAGGRKLLHCLDFSDFSDSDPSGRRVMREHLLGDGSPIERLGFFGGGYFQRSLVNLYSRVSPIPMKYLKSREEAVDWLLKGAC